ncbi:hypothetical protein [Desulfovulcanus sp.]
MICPICGERWAIRGDYITANCNEQLVSIDIAYIFQKQRESYYSDEMVICDYCKENKNKNGWERFEIIISKTIEVI